LRGIVGGLREGFACPEPPLRVDLLHHAAFLAFFGVKIRKNGSSRSSGGTQSAIERTQSTIEGTKSAFEGTPRTIGGTKRAFEGTPSGLGGKKCCIVGEKMLHRRNSGCEKNGLNRPFLEKNTRVWHVNCSRFVRNNPAREKSPPGGKNFP